MKALLRTFRYLKAYLFLVLIALVAMLISTAGNLAVPFLSQRLIDQGLSAGNAALITRLALLMVGIALLRALFTFLEGYLSAQVSQGVAYDMRNDLYEKIQHLSFSYHDRAQTGQLLTRVTSDVELVQQFLGTALLQLLGAAILLVGSISLMIGTSPTTTLVMVAIGPVAIAVFVFFFAQARPLFTATQERLEEVNIVLQENLVGVRVVRAFVRRLYEIARFAEKNEALRDVQIEVGHILALAIPLVFLLASLAQMGVTWVGGMQVINERMTIGELVAFTQYILMALFPIFMISFLLANLVQAAAGAQRIFQILDTPMEIRERPGAVSLPEVRGRITFDHVWFRYFDNQPWILRDIDFTAEPGYRVALLGATGSGKSTITNLIPRFYDATQGQVCIDGQDVRDVTLDSLRQQVGSVLQETLLFGGTIQENIAFGRPDATLEEIVEAAQAAQAHDFITAFPNGYETQIGERGVQLSGGQKQRVAIARALLINPQVLILDDATSAVDFQTELKLRQALERLMEGRTSFIIAQRVSTVRDADLILVLEAGQIAALGKHEELLETSPLYAEIYYSQLEGDDETGTDYLLYAADVTPQEVAS
ncbi:MAG: ABC transporter ATP-binding protein [Anaerolineales bacterium]